MQAFYSFNQKNDSFHPVWFPGCPGEVHSHGRLFWLGELGETIFPYIMSLSTNKFLLEI